MTAVNTPAVNCPLIHIGTPPPTSIVFLNPDQAGTYARVTFVQPLSSYDQALDAVSNLGLRMANLCYERAQQTPTAWQPMGQQSMFLSSQSLVVATTVNASNQWPDQLRALAGVASVAAPYTASCS